eukprot:3656250-Rhodomonas_salina.1
MLAAEVKSEDKPEVKVEVKEELKEDVKAEVKEEEEEEYEDEDDSLAGDIMAAMESDDEGEEEERDEADRKGLECTRKAEGLVGQRVEGGPDFVVCSGMTDHDKDMLHAAGDSPLPLLHVLQMVRLLLWRLDFAGSGSACAEAGSEKKAQWREGRGERAIVKGLETA